MPSAQHQKPQETRPREPTTERVLERLHASQVRRPGTDRKSCTTRDSWLPYEQMVQGASHQLASAAHLAAAKRSNPQLSQSIASQSFPKQLSEIQAIADP
ncbi:hypothetical protein AVEN_4223-1 [Araneus ventricosus]|uniref:Uncharacterized protein n=1 Tax=Araneus ventricosus TaxID=182803 RepID=A0A4Y2LZH7_ARAVE|nr:hypothetical protein AVEN_4223-1 [Araneus ventricosus]